MKIDRHHHYWLLLFLLLALAGCTTSTVVNPTINPAPIRLMPGFSVGQTFVARDDGLNEITLFLAPDTPGDGTVTLRIFSDVQSKAVLAQTTLVLAALQSPAAYSFQFTPLRHSASNYYYLDLALLGTGTLSVPLNPGFSYLDGTAYSNYEPQDANLQFAMAYTPRDQWLGRLGRSAHWSLVLLLGFLLFVLPGWGLLRLLWQSSRTYPWPTQLALATALSLCLPILLMLWIEPTGVRPGRLFAYGLVALAFGTFIIDLRQWRPGAASWQHWKNAPDRWSSGATVLLFLLIFIVRMANIDPLEGPSWGDSVQHTVMAQLILDNGGLFRSWEPYAPYETLTVQFGFSALVALYSWLSGLPILNAVLIVGQLLNVFAVFSIYPLATKLTQGHRWGGVIAVLIAGMLSPMPAYYVNWGKYAQLAGQVVFPVAVWMTWELLEKERFHWRWVVMTGFMLSAMSLIYYRAPIYYATGVLSLLLCLFLPQHGRKLANWRIPLLHLLGTGIVLLGLLVPWANHLLGARLVNFVLSAPATQELLIKGIIEDYAPWNEIWFYVPWPILITAFVGLAWALIRRQWAVVSLGLWTVFISLYVAGRIIHLPGASALQSFAVIIALYIQASLIASWLITVGITALIGRLPRLGEPLLLVAVMLGAMLGYASQVAIIKPYYIMIMRPDRMAFEWIRTSTPANAAFLVEGFIYHNTSAIGSDAGWWIPLLANRKNTMPPQYALLNERPTPLNYTREVMNLITLLKAAPLASPAVTQELCRRGITHIYIGQGNGYIGTDADQLFSASEAQQSSTYELVYRRDRVAIFALRPGVCAAP